VNKTQTRIVDAALKALGKCPGFEGEIDNLTQLRDELQEEFDGLGEKAQSNDNGQALEAAISNLDEAIEAIQAIVEKVEEAAAALDEASASWTPRARNGHEWDRQSEVPPQFLPARHSKPEGGWMGPYGWSARRISALVGWWCPKCIDGLRKLMQARLSRPSSLSDFHEGVQWPRKSRLCGRRSGTFSPRVITKSDGRFANGGTHDAVETEALSQLLIVQIVRDRLDELLPAPLADFAAAETAERARLRALLGGAADWREWRA
jgi:hypothetical protein